MKNIDENLLLSDIAAEGYDVKSIYELENITKKDEVLVPVIIKHINLVEPPNLKEWFVRCLSKKGFYSASAFLIEEFKHNINGSYKWAIGNAIEIINDPSIYNDLIEIALDRSHKSDREMIVMALGRYKKNIEVRKVLIDLLSDKDVNGHALEALKKCGEVEDIVYIEPLLSDANPWIKKQAEKAIRQIKKRSEKNK